MTTSLTDVETLRRASVAMITEAWDALAAEHVVPCSRYRPYVQVGRDYEGLALSGSPAFTRFSETLRQLYPAWFDALSGQSPRWYPDTLAFQFVDAAIAELTRRGETGGPPSDAVPHHRCATASSTAIRARVADDGTSARTRRER
jgi:hypothetical protein